MVMGVYKNGEGPSGLLALPEAAWELLLGIYCMERLPVVEPHCEARGDRSSVSSGGHRGEASAPAHAILEWR